MNETSDDEETMMALERQQAAGPQYTFRPVGHCCLPFFPVITFLCFMSMFYFVA